MARPKTDLTPEQQRELAARVRQLVTAERAVKDDLRAVILMALSTVDSVLDMTGLQRSIYDVLRAAHENGEAMAREHLRQDLEARLPPLAPKKRNDPWPLLLVASAATVASYVARDVARRKLAGDAWTPKAVALQAKSTIERAGVGAVFGGYGVGQRAVTDIDRPANKTASRLMRRWCATLDRGTCALCRGSDGLTVPLGRSFRPEPPAHPYCRCFCMVIEVDR